MSTIEALFIFDENNTPLLEHVYAGRPASGSTLLPLYLAHPTPRPSLMYLPSTNPAMLLYSVVQDQLLFLAPCAADNEPLQVLEFLHRVADVLEDFLGAPLLASKIESNYDVVAQLLNEMVDGGIISCTEPNALRDLVDAPSLMKSLLGNVGLPSTTPSSLASAGAPFSLGRGGPSPRLGPSNSAQSTSPVPWRRANVRHTSNEMYVDIVETLSVTLSPSGRPLAALANGTIAFTAKVSGIPDLNLLLGCPGGIANAISLPVFHPCVRLNRWKERPGDLSFVPPDGRFVLAGYEVDLLGPAALDALTPSAPATPLNIPATASVATSLGPAAADFEVRLALNPRFSKPPAPSRARPAANTGTSAAPALDDLELRIPLPPAVANVTALRVPRGAGDVTYAPGASHIAWRLSARDVAHLMAQDRGTGCAAVLSGTVVGATEEGAAYDDALGPAPYAYDDDGPSSSKPAHRGDSGNSNAGDPAKADAARRAAMRHLMPSAASLSFSVKGWLASGIRVESLSVDAKKSQGLGGGVTPYKGVKYLCVSRGGVECRC
ncbi:Adaptor complexes medium subunit family-domain-containing protein [Boeremia exigua]|uniref:Adaptor complexes medium subunit family-domain-containing protein n=1 Tax=Boeremia exigua TaxID=749465 RepID=UPI001E8CCCAE|nr:Adaptor complexes medium subunit family-domain-containing protein [Boeremia exigua]KAH6633694.1 Adaptor complexes medium subunit family-domain-containing protein [Boeremia exigua]